MPPWKWQPRLLATAAYMVLVHVEIIPLSAGGGEYLKAMLEPPTAELVAKLDGRRGLSRLLIESIAEAVVRAAPCPVLTVKQPAHIIAY